MSQNVLRMGTTLTCHDKILNILKEKKYFLAMQNSQ